MARRETRSWGAIGGEARRPGRSPASWYRPRFPAVRATGSAASTVVVSDALALRTSFPVAPLVFRLACARRPAAPFLRQSPR